MIILQMKSLQLLLLHVLLALLALVTVLSDGSSNSAVLALNRIGLDGVGDRQLLMAFNSALREMIQDGEYYRLLEKWDLQDFSNDECKDKYNPMFQWPENPAHLLNTILVTSESIAWVHDSNLGLPFWNGTAGFEADLAKTITSRIGGHYNKHVEMRWVAPLVNPDGWFQSLYQNLYNLASDIVMSRVFITPERAQLVDYTCGYLYNYNGIIRGTLEPSKNLSTLEQINAPGIQVAVVRGTFYDRLGTTLNQATMYIASSFQLAVEMVAQEQAHVLITDFISAGKQRAARYSLLTYLNLA
eukprot:GEZU01013488.1.p1 GENE.GEZU01013488.1~~GEZU01013488.1.p1  ORF type:complete len:300 (-),score=35.70 GEZU01013488.1:26-925(-)